MARLFGVGRAELAPVAQAIRAAVARSHSLAVADVQLLAAGAIPRTTSGKLACRASRAEYLRMFSAIRRDTDPEA